MAVKRKVEEHPRLRRVKIADLRPTQGSIGVREVMRKVASWSALDVQDERRFLGDHMIPVVIGPKERHYIIDNHHLTRALHEAGLSEVLVRPVAFLHRLEVDEFWHVMDCHNWIYLYGATGQRIGVDSLPKTVAEMSDNPFRSLAGDVRRAGGYAKDTAPYSEFLWADFLRRRMKVPLLDKDYDAAVGEALALAHSSKARHLPGWCGVED
jgi:hypothetical protein